MKPGASGFGKRVCQSDMDGNAYILAKCPSILQKQEGAVLNCEIAPDFNSVRHCNCVSSKDGRSILCKHTAQFFVAVWMKIICEGSIRRIQLKSCTGQLPFYEEL